MTCPCDAWPRVLDEIVDPIVSIILLVVLAFALWRQRRIMRLVTKALSHRHGPMKD